MSTIEGSKRPRSFFDKLKEITKGESPNSQQEEVSIAGEVPRPEIKRERPKNIPHPISERVMPPPLPQMRPRKWSDKSVSIDSINLRSLPINWNALTNLGKSLNRLADNRVSREDIANLKPPTDVYFGIPMVASVIAHQRNKEIPIQLPSKEQIGKMKWYVNELYEYLNYFSERIAEKFRRYVEREGERTVLKAGLKVADVANLIGAIENPRQQMLHEVAMLYRNFQQPQISEGILWDDEVPIEDKIYNFLNALKHVKHDPQIFNAVAYRNYPILLQLLPKLNLPSDEFDAWSASIAGAELMEGLEMFLRRRGMPDIQPAPQPQEFDLFDLTSWPRAMAEAFSGEKLQRVKRDLPDILEQALTALPENGPQLANQIYAVAENVCVLHAQGTSDGELAHNIFVKN